MFIKATSKYTTLNICTKKRSGHQIIRNHVVVLVLTFIKFKIELVRKHAVLTSCVFNVPFIIYLLNTLQTLITNENHLHIPATFPLKQEKLYICSIEKRFTIFNSFNYSNLRNIPK